LLFPRQQRLFTSKFDGLGIIGAIAGNNTINIQDQTGKIRSSHFAGATGTNLIFTFPPVFIHF
jgi:hypothetical protein